MYCKFKYLDAANNWNTFGNVISPCNIGDSIINEVSSAYSIKLYFKGQNEIDKNSLIPGTIVRLDFDTRYFDMVIVDGGKIEPVSNTDFCYHVYTIQELLAYMREVETQVGYFSFDKYSVSEFFTRLLALSDYDKTIVISENEDYNLLLENWQRSDYQITSRNLLDNLLKVSQTNQVRVKARINISGQIELYFVSLKGSDILNEINGRLIGSNKQYIGSNYASKVSAQINNLTDDKYSWLPYLDVRKGFIITPDSDDSVSITQDSAVIKLRSNIKQATHVRVHGFGQMITNSNTPMSGYAGSDYRVFTKDGTRIYPDSGKYVNWDYDELAPLNTYKEYDVKIYEDWLQLKPDDSEGDTVHRENTLYYKRGENKIFNMGICDGQLNAADCPEMAFYVEVWEGGAKVSTTSLYPILRWHLNRAIVFVSLMGDSLIKINNKNSSKRTTLYSQEDNLVAGNTLAKNMKKHIDSMSNKDESYTYVFDSIEKVPIAGDIFNGKVISQVICNAYYEKIEATLTLSDNLVKKSEYVSADEGVFLGVINPNKAFDRFTNYHTQLWFCSTYGEALEVLNSFGIDSYFNKYYADKLLDAMKNGRTSAATGFIEVNMKTANNDGIWYTGSELEVKTVGNSLTVQFKTLNNSSIGYGVYDMGSDLNFDDLEFLPQNFIGGSGFSDTLHLKFRISKPYTEKYPLLTPSDFSSTVGMIAEIEDTEYYHDPGEVVNVVYQIEANVYDSKGYVKSEYFDECSILKDCFFDSDSYIRKVEFTSLDGEIISQFVSDVVFTDQSGTGIYSVDIKVTTTLEVGTEGYLVLNIMNDGSYTNVRSMMKTRAVIFESGNEKYIRYYVVFTK